MGVFEKHLDLLDLRVVPVGTLFPNPSEGWRCGGAVTADGAVQSDALPLRGCQQAADDGSLRNVW